VIEAQDKPPIVCIHFEGWKSVKDEFLSLKSIRLAPFGFYTNRFEIPRYRITSESIDGNMAFKSEIVNSFKPSNIVPSDFSRVKTYGLEKVKKLEISDFKTESEGFDCEWMKEFLDSHSDDGYFDHNSATNSSKYPGAVSIRHFQEILSSQRGGL
jgi:hypothetical protein